MNFFIDNIFLILVAFVSGGMLLWPLVNKSSRQNLVGTLEATQLLNTRNGILVDLREDNQVTGGIIPQALRLPFSNFQDKRDPCGRSVHCILIYYERVALKAVESQSACSTVNI